MKYTFPDRLLPFFSKADPATNSFSASEGLGDTLCVQALANADLIEAPSWEPYGWDGTQRLLYWDSDEAADNDDGAAAAGQILKQPSAS